CQPDNQNVDFSGSDQIQTPQYPDVNPPSPKINKESLENPFNEIADNESDLEPKATTDTELSSTKDIHPLAVQESPHDSDICQLIIEECCIEVPEEQKQKMENTMFDLVKICHHKQFLCIHDDIDDLIERALNSKLLSINSQRLDKKEQEVKNEEIRLIENLVYDNSFPRPPEELNAKIADTIIESIPLLPIPVQDGNSQQEEIDIVTEIEDLLPSSVENDDDDYDLLLGEADLFLFDNSIPPGIENIADDPEGDDYPLMVEDFLYRIFVPVSKTF
nr:hypothetical protein [Tanacetum cinerariifolium]